MVFLTLNLHKRFFDEIVNGTKKKEFRQVKKYWANRIEGRFYEALVFKNGYAKNAPTAVFRYEGFEKEKIECPLFGPGNVEVYALKIGDRLW